MTTAPVPTRSEPGKEVDAARTVAVLDTSALVADSAVIDELARAGSVDVVIPLSVLESLDDHKARTDDVGFGVRAVLRRLEELRAGRDLTQPVVLDSGATVRVELNNVRSETVRAAGLSDRKTQNRVLAVAVNLAEAAEAGTTVALYANDASLLVKAARFGLDAREWVRHDRFEQVDAFATVDAAGDVVDRLHAYETVPAVEVGGDGPEPGVIVRGPTGSSALARRVDRGVRLLAHHEPWGLRARNKEQRLALDVLHDPDVAVVALTGAAGTGKTILALAAGLGQVVDDRRYRSVGVYRPVVSVGAHDLGFLPGDLDEKLDPWFGAIVDNLVAMSSSEEDASKVRDELVARRQLQYGSIAHVRGRSLAHTFICVDECQNLEPAALKVIISRLGDGAKICLVGDSSQIDSPYLSARSNALSSLISAFRGQDFFAHVHLTKGERSKIADAAANLL